MEFCLYWLIKYWLLIGQIKTRRNIFSTEVEIEEFFEERFFREIGQWWTDIGQIKESSRHFDRWLGAESHSN